LEITKNVAVHNSRTF